MLWFLIIPRDSYRVPLHESYGWFLCIPLGFPYIPTEFLWIPMYSYDLLPQLPFWLIWLMMFYSMDRDLILLWNCNKHSQFILLHFALYILQRKFMNNFSNIHETQIFHRNFMKKNNTTCLWTKSSGTQESCVLEGTTIYL